MMKLSLTMFHFLFQRFMLKTQWEKIKNTVGENQKHCGSDFKTLRERVIAPSVFYRVKHET